MNVVQALNSLEQFKNVVKYNPNFLFRGQPNSAWGLMPSLGRIAQSKGLTYPETIQLERECIDLFQINAKNLLPYNEWHLLTHGALWDGLGWLTIMQHYGAPTRCLDWSISPLVALYFACLSEHNADATVWVADFDAVSNSNQHLANNEHTNEMLFQPNDINEIFFLKATNANERIRSQQGRFSIAVNPTKDHKELLESKTSLWSLQIPAASKLNILRELYTMNTNARTLFPGLEGLGKSFQEYALLWDKTSSTF